MYFIFILSVIIFVSYLRISVQIIVFVIIFAHFW